MGGCVWQTGCRSTLIALFEERVLFRLEPQLYRGQDGVAAYFDGLPRWASPAVQFTDVQTARAGGDVINVAGTATFRVELGAEPLTVKISWVIIREDFNWKIVSHHVSSKAPLI